MFHTLGNVEGFELCEIFAIFQCPHCMKYWKERIVYCDCGTCSVPTEATRELNRERNDVLTITNFTIKKGGNRGARHCRSEE